jgi:peptidoglycan LD-endopeptidase CwlK
MPILLSSRMPRMPTFSVKSKTILETCHPDLQKLAAHAIQLTDFTVIYGYRSPEKQLELYSKGRELREGIWVVTDLNKIVTYKDGTIHKSKHNYSPSLAFDLAPYPIDWSNSPTATARFYFLSGIMLGLADQLRIKIRLGADFNMDGDILNDKFKDIGHFELVDEG